MRALLLGLALGLAACILPEQELATETDICFDCAQMPCSGQIQACRANEDCGALLTCVQGCNGDDCTDACVSGNPEGIMLATPVLDCATTSCADVCASLSGP